MCGGWVYAICIQSSCIVGLLVVVVGLNFTPKTKSAYFLPFECFAGSETCLFCFLCWSFSLCSFLCCSKPAAFFSLLDKNSSTLAGNRRITHFKTLPFCLHLKGVCSIPILLDINPYSESATYSTVVQIQYTALSYILIH